MLPLTVQGGMRNRDDMIRRWLERWIGHDRLLVSYEKLRERHRNLQETHERTIANLHRQRAELTRLQRRYTRALVELEWERFLREVNDLGSDNCEKIKLMGHDQAWEVADLLTERFGKSMYAYRCRRCPSNPITHDLWWHVTRQKTGRRRHA